MRQVHPLTLSLASVFRTCVLKQTSSSHLISYVMSLSAKSIRSVTPLTTRADGHIFGGYFDFFGKMNHRLLLHWRNAVISCFFVFKSKPSSKTAAGPLVDLWKLYWNSARCWTRPALTSFGTCLLCRFDKRHILLKAIDSWKCVFPLWELWKQNNVFQLFNFSYIWLKKRVSSGRQADMK